MWEARPGDVTPNRRRSFGHRLGATWELEGSVRLSTFDCTTIRYLTQDEKYVTLMMWQDEARFFPLFAQAAGYEDLLEDPRYNTPENRAANLSELLSEVRRRFAERTRSEWVELLTDSDCIWGLNQTPKDIAEDPQVRANGYILEIDRGTEKPFRAVGAPILFDGNAPKARHAAQSPGQSTEEVLRQSGASSGEIEDAKKNSAIR